MLGDKGDELDGVYVDSVEETYFHFGNDMLMVSCFCVFVLLTCFLSVLI